MSSEFSFTIVKLKCRCSCIFDEVSMDILIYLEKKPLKPCVRKRNLIARNCRLSSKSQCSFFVSLLEYFHLICSYVMFDSCSICCEFLPKSGEKSLIRDYLIWAIIALF